jgi:hypothetical protein
VNLPTSRRANSCSTGRWTTFPPPADPLFASYLSEDAERDCRTAALSRKLLIRRIRLRSPHQAPAGAGLDYVSFCSSSRL